MQETTGVIRQLWNGNASSADATGDGMPPRHILCQDTTMSSAAPWDNKLLSRDMICPRCLADDARSPGVEPQKYLGNGSQALGQPVCLALCMRSLTAVLVALSRHVAQLLGPARQVTCTKGLFQLGTSLMEFSDISL